MASSFCVTCFVVSSYLFGRSVGPFIEGVLGLAVLRSSWSWSKVSWFVSFFSFSAYLVTNVSSCFHSALFVTSWSDCLSVGFVILVASRASFGFGISLSFESLQGRGDFDLDLKALGDLSLAFLTREVDMREGGLGVEALGFPFAGKGVGGR